MSGRRRVVLTAFVAGCIAYVNAPTLGFALDDVGILRNNALVTEGRVLDAFTSPYWELEPGVEFLYRPVLLASFAGEWSLWGDRPAVFHAVNVLAHAAVCVLVALLLLRLLPPTGRVLGASLGAVLFAVHPMHVEAVANVVGRGELYAAGAFVVACLLFLLRPDGDAGRGGRLVGVALAYAVALGSKEIAVTLPLVLVLLAFHPASRRREGGGKGVWRTELPIFVLLGAVLASYLVVRWHVLGSVAGAEVPAELVGTTPAQRVYTALTLWPQYLRLIFFPLDLVADYGPGVFGAAEVFDLEVAAGAVSVVGLLTATWLLRRRAPAASLGIAWFMITMLPVAHLGVHAGVLLAERTLYLPSVGVALVAGSVGRRIAGLGAPKARRVVAAAVGVLLLLTVRTVTRTPVWENTFTLWRDLSVDHPESHRAHRFHGDLLMNAGRTQEAADAFARAAEIHPNRFPVLLEAGAAAKVAGRSDEARALLRRAVAQSSDRRQPYRLLAEIHLRARRGREAHLAAVTGLARVGPDPELWGFLSESYLLRRDLAAALRARRAGLGVDPDDGEGWNRLAEILEMAGDTSAAEEARERAAEVGRADRGTASEGPP